MAFRVGLLNKIGPKPNFHRPRSKGVTSERSITHPTAIMRSKDLERHVKKGPKLKHIVQESNPSQLHMCDLKMVQMVLK